MNLKLIGSHLEITPALQEYVNTKFQRIARHTESAISITVTLSTDKTAQQAYADLHVAGKSMHGEASHKDMYAAIDLLVDKLIRLFIKNKEKTAQHTPHHHFS